VRAFLAVPADPQWVTAARELVAGLAPRLPRAAWTKADAWHVTLKFFGDISEEAAGHFAEALAPSMTRLPGLELESSDPLVLPERGRPRTLAVGFSKNAALGALDDLARSAEQVCRGLGFPADDRPFRPHVTLARLRDPWPRQAIEEFRRGVAGRALPRWRVAGFTLYRSQLDPSGAVHTALREWRAA
jgi:RNA 2',3'-cyclic 3'-phosphodiesterase